MAEAQVQPPVQGPLSRDNTARPIGPTDCPTCGVGFAAEVSLRQAVGQRAVSALHGSLTPYARAYRSRSQLNLPDVQLVPRADYDDP